MACTDVLLPSVEMPGVVRDDPSLPGLDPPLLLESSECVVGSDPSVIIFSDVPSDVPVSVTLISSVSTGELELIWIAEKYKAK